MRLRFHSCLALIAVSTLPMGGESMELSLGSIDPNIRTQNMLELSQTGWNPFKKGKRKGRKGNKSPNKKGNKSPSKKPNVNDDTAEKAKLEQKKAADEKRKAEDEKKKAEDEKNKAEDEKKKAEEARKKADDDKRRADEASHSTAQ